eukprot:2277710-Lingulodinium_polyedra.AAC.1
MARPASFRSTCLRPRGSRSSASLQKSAPWASAPLSGETLIPTSHCRGMQLMLKPPQRFTSSGQ